MSTKVFFSFHYERDVQRASVVRNHWVTKESEKESGFIDKASWESIERKGSAAVKEWISSQLSGTQVAVVLIGAETSTREWVRYELEKSLDRGNGIFGVYIHNIKGFDQKTDSMGSTSFGSIGKDSYGNNIYLYQIAKTYDWINDDGYNNFAKWVATAKKK